MKRIEIRVPDELADAIEAEAESCGASAAAIAREYIRRGMDARAIDERLADLEVMVRAALRLAAGGALYAQEAAQRGLQADAQTRLQGVIKSSIQPLIERQIQEGNDE